MSTATLVVSSVGLAVSLVVLALSLRSDRRSRERSHVDWQARRLTPGTFHIENIGSDHAFEVTVEMWTPEETVNATCKVIPPREGIEVALPLREEHGPDVVEVVADVTPPSGGNPLAEMLARESEKTREMIISSQVDVEVVWRSRRGVWSSKHFKTG